MPDNLHQHHVQRKHEEEHRGLERLGTLGYGEKEGLMRWREGKDSCQENSRGDFTINTSTNVLGCQRKSTVCLGWGQSGI